MRSIAYVCCIRCLFGGTKSNFWSPHPNRKSLCKRSLFRKYTRVSTLFSNMSVEIGKVATVELIRELERRFKCNELKSEK